MSDQSPASENEKTKTTKAPVKPAPEPVAAPEPTPAPEPVASEPEATFPVARLIQEGKTILGYESYEVAGALHGQTEPLTIDAARSAVADWLGAPPAQEG